MDIKKIQELYPPYEKKMSTRCKDMSGMRFGQLQVLYRYYQNTPQGQARWVCLCDCGKISTPRGAALRNGTATSCGCLTYKNAAKANIHDITGQRFGKLVVLHDSGKRKNHKVIWTCRCDCGAIVDRISDSLVQKDSISCGHCAQSIGSVNIEQVLVDNNIPCEMEKTFPDCLGKNNVPFRYDFYLPTYRRLIEFDGIQHFKQRDVFEDFDVIHARDLQKNLYALQNDYELVRIPYWKRDSITLDTILGDKYLVEE